MVARLIAQHAAGDLKQSIVVDNRAGGAGVIGSVAAARAEPDGHTLVLGTNQTHATNQSLLKNCPYDAVKDFAPVAGIADIPHVLVARRSLPAASVAELVARRESRAGRDALRLDRQRLGLASRRGAVQRHGRHRAAARAVPWRGADDDGADRRPHRRELCDVAERDRQIEAGELEGAGGRERRPRRAPAAMCRRSAKQASRASRPTPGSRCSRRRARRRPRIERLHRAVAAASSTDAARGGIRRAGHDGSRCAARPRSRPGCRAKCRNGRR